MDSFLSNVYISGKMASKTNRKRKQLATCLDHDYVNKVIVTVENEQPGKTPKSKDCDISTTAKPLVRCRVCYREFSRRAALLPHYQRHHNKSGWRQKCPICFKNFEGYGYLTKHLKTHVVEDVVCEFCDLNLPSESQLKIHKALEHPKAKPKPKPEQKPKPKVKVKEAPKRGKISEPQQPNAKKIKEDKKVTFKCHTCPETFEDHKKFIRHTRIRHLFVCCICGMTFKKGEKLKAHEKSCHEHDVLNESPDGKCTICDEEFGNALTFYSHMKVFHDRLMYSCNDCDKTLVNKEDLFKHSKKEHRKVPLVLTKKKIRIKQNDDLVVQRVYCHLCTLNILNVNDLIDHMQLHEIHTWKWFKCKRCPLSFFARDLVKIHTQHIHGSDNDNDTEDKDPLQNGDCNIDVKTEADTIKEIKEEEEDEEIIYLPGEMSLFPEDRIKTETEIKQEMDDSDVDSFENDDGELILSDIKVENEEFVQP